MLLAEDHNVVREALRLLLEATSGLEVLEAGTGREALTVALTQPVDLVLLDVEMPEMNGLEVLRAIRESKPDLPVVILSNYDDINVLQEALEAGARGYVLKVATAPQLKEAIDTALFGQGVYIHPLAARRLLGRGGHDDPAKLLSPREGQVLSMLVDGARNDEIARALSIAPRTVKVHITSIFRKLGVTNRTEAVAKAIRRELGRGRDRLGHDTSLPEAGPPPTTPA